jgi:ankyrin repeat protein
MQNNDLMLPSCCFNRDLQDELISYAKMAIIAGYSVNLVQLLLAEFQDAAQDWKDENGNSLLHHACMKSGAEISCMTIAFLVNWLPESCTIVNNNGKTPKDLLKEAASYKDNAGRLLIHRFAKLEATFLFESNVSADEINFVADAYPNSITVPDHNGMLPFHHACLNSWCGSNIVFTLLQRYPPSLIVTPSMVCVVQESKRIKLG